jgi:hypothetical protein
MVLPVKVALDRNNVLVHTINISRSGARIGGIQEELKPGQLVILSRAAKKAQFRVVWVQQLGSREFHAGLEALQPQEQFWGVNLEAKEHESQQDMKMLLQVLKGAKT